jgi:hypothetical protein
MPVNPIAHQAGQAAVLGRLYLSVGSLVLLPIFFAKWRIRIPENK